MVFVNGSSYDCSSAAFCPVTRRVFLVFEKLDVDGEWKPSGIAASEAEYGAIELNVDRWLVIPVELLREVGRRFHRQENIEIGGRNKNFKGIVFPIEELLHAD